MKPKMPNSAFCIVFLHWIDWDLHFNKFWNRQSNAFCMVCPSASLVLLLEPWLLLWDGWVWAEQLTDCFSEKERCHFISNYIENRDRKDIYETTNYKSKQYSESSHQLLNVFTAMLFKELKSYLAALFW